MKKYLLLFGLFLLTYAASAQDKAIWKFSSKPISESVYELQFEVAIDDAFVMYAMEEVKDGPAPLEFNFEKNDNYILEGSMQSSQASKTKYDEGFELNVPYYTSKVVFTQQVKLVNPTTVKGTLSYQVCTEGQCIPGDASFSFSLGTADASAATAEASATSTPPVAPISAPDSSNDAWFSFFFFALIAGLVSVLTPCVFPMIPMVISFFMNGSKSKFDTIAKGLIFTLSVTLLYTSIGIVVSMTKNVSFANALATSWIPNLLFFCLFIFFALSFLGLFEISLPSGLANKADQQVDKGGYMASAFMAVVLVIVSFSCTGPFVGSILAEAVSDGGSKIKPIAGMFGFGFGLGLPFLILSAIPSLVTQLPKSGGWLNAVKVVFAFIMIGFSLKYLNVVDADLGLNFLTRDVFTAIWIVLSVLLGLYLLGKIRFDHDTPVEHINVLRLFLAGGAFVFAVYLLPGMFGAPLAGMSGFMPAQEEQSFDLTTQISPSGSGNASMSVGTCGPAKYAEFLHLPKGVNGYFDLQQGLACAKEQNKPVLIDFKGHRCSNCKKMEKEVFVDPAVIQMLNEHFVVIALYTDDKTVLPESEWKTNAKLEPLKTIGDINAYYELSKFGQVAQPYFVIVDHNENVLAQGIGYEDNANDFLNWLKLVIK